MTSLEWLETPGAVDGLTILREMSELVFMNGGMAWKGFGTFQRGPYGRIGLTLEEAIRLVYLSGKLDGFFHAEDSANKAAVIEAIKKQIEVIKNEKGDEPPQIVGTDGAPLRPKD